MYPENNAIGKIREIMNGPADEYKNITSRLLEYNHLIKTEDGTYTICSEVESELMHSKIGAMREAFEKFATPSDIKKLKTPHILDLCSGLGYNALAALVHNSGSTIDMLEICMEMIFLSQYLDSIYCEKEILNKAVKGFFDDEPVGNIRIFCDDARKILQQRMPEKYDVIFHDGFSPSNEPALYTVEFLRLLKKHMGEKSVLLSYSSSIPFRSALIEAGFYLGEGPSIGRKRGITIAAIQRDDYRIQNRLPADDEKLIALTTIGIPFRDKNLNDTAVNIINRRSVERKSARDKGIYISAKKIKKNKIDHKFTLIQKQHRNSRDAVMALKEYLLTKTQN